MKKLIFLLVCLPFVVVKARAQFTITNTSTITIADLRTGDWPLQLQRIVKHNDTMYLLSFRDKQYPNSHNLSTLKFTNLAQLRYLEQGLTYLMGADNGTEATYKGFSIKRTDDNASTGKVKKKMAKFTLVCAEEGNVTDIQQTEADNLVKAIKSL